MAGKALKSSGKISLNGCVRQWIALENGVPSHEGIAQVISRIPAADMSGCFIEWVRSVAELTDGKIVAIDGKIVRGSYDNKDKLGAIHMVSAWVNQAGMSLGQIKTSEKSNEITAISILFELLEIKNYMQSPKLQPKISRPKRISMSSG